MSKKSLPLSKDYALIEPGPAVLLTTAASGQSNVMAMSWHPMLEFEPPLIGCVVSNRNHSYSLLKRSRECAINIPTADHSPLWVRQLHGRRRDDQAALENEAA
jgi:flavin reductase (DIM6/NTAB) family NADH-FMN oxidoreductase RutF